VSEKILIVEDENHIRESTMRLLQRKGYCVEGAGSGVEALEKIGSESFDLLLVDIKMPGMSGLEMLRRATGINPEIMALFITGYGTVESAIEALELGAVGFVRKPITIDNLAKSIDNALARGRLRKENARLQALMPLFELSKGLLSEVNENKLFNLILDTVASETGADIIQILLWDNAGNLIMKAAHGPSPTEGIGEIVVDEIAVKASSTREPVVISRKDGNIIDNPEKIQSLKSGCDIYLPVVASGEAIGVMKATKLGDDGKSFKQSDVEFLFTLCGQGAIAIANARLFESVQREQAEVERLLKRVISTTEDERMRLSLELHDGPVQSIVASQYGVEACKNLIDKNELDKAKSRLQIIPQLLAQSIDSLRRIICDLHPPALDKGGILSAVQDYLSHLERDAGISYDLDVRGTPARLSPDTERGTYYMVREALTNVRKHAAASKVHVLVGFQGDSLAVEISDNGKGFDPSIKGDDPGRKHLGIESMKERASVLQGNIVIDSKPENGTTVKLIVPINNNSATG
jgi:signal transduction histidine kinase